MICIFLLGGILTAGLWPFHSPRNQVWWLAGGQGLQFGRHGTILSSRAFPAAPKQANAPCSVEIWLEPSPATTGGTVLAFYAREAPRRFSIYQYYTGLVFQSRLQGEYQRDRTTAFYVHGIFRQGKQAFITIASDGEQTSVYVDGILAKHALSFPLSSQDLAGQLVIADSPTNADSWSGVLRGLALFSQDLTPAQVLHHYETWTKDGRPDISKGDRALALYLLDESEGKLVHNQIPSGVDLYIPERFVVVDQYFLEPFWKEYKPTWSYCEDFLINIAGFFPLGFMFCAYLSVAGKVKRPALLTLLLGFAVSLTIEVTQAYLPTRASGMTDVFTNTSGTGLGIWLYRLVSRQGLLAKLWAYLPGWLWTKV
ncbi:MAG: VanZ family protein [Terriglobia bacterium]